MLRIPEIYIFRLTLEEFGFIPQESEIRDKDTLIHV